MYLLSISVFIPLAAAVLMALLVPKKQPRAACTVALFASLAVLIITGGLAIAYDPANPEQFQFRETAEWIPSIGATYMLYADGLSLILAALTAFLTVLICINGLKSGSDHGRNFYALLLALETGVLGSFFAMDLLLFYIFWELMLIPLYFLIAFWGSANRMYAAFKFFAFTLAGSLVMLVGFLALYYYHHEATGVWTFSVLDLYESNLAPAIQGWIFAALFAGFAIKVPIFPFHTWLPDAHTEAPTAGSVILAGVLLKVGVYGFIRFALPILPAATTAWGPVLGILGIVGILAGSLAAIAQSDAKRLVAYSSVGHMGLIVLALAALNTESLQGASLQMVCHGLATGGLFLCVGMLYDRRHSREIADYGGVATVMPVFAVLFTLIILSSVGLPGLCGFAGEIVIFLGVVKTNAVWAAVAVLGVILSAVYLLWMYQRVMQGPVKHEENKQLKDLVPTEFLALLPIVLVSLWIGLYPKPFLDRFDSATRRVIERTAPYSQARHEAARSADPVLAMDWAATDEGARGASAPAAEHE